MTTAFTTRELLRHDLPAVATILDQTGLFPSAMLAEMAAPYLGREAQDLWLVICADDAVIGFAFCEPERLTDRTYNLLAIAVRPACQSQGIGSALVGALERRLCEMGARLLLVETSSLDPYEPTRRFYDRLAFTREARIRDFYADGEDKILFWKRLAPVG